MKVSPWIRAAIYYFLLALGAGFVFGTIRVLIVVPRIGELAALLIEIPLMLGISWWACAWVLHRHQIPPHPSLRLRLGALALTLLLVTEWLLGLVLFDRDLLEILTDYQSAAGVVGLMAQVIFGLIPWLQAKVSPPN